MPLGAVAGKRDVDSVTVFYQLFSCSLSLPLSRHMLQAEIAVCVQ